MKKRFEIAGMRKHLRIRHGGGGNLLEQEPPKAIPEYEIVLREKDSSTLFFLFLREEEGECPSGYTIARWGVVYMREGRVGEPAGPLTHVPRKRMWVELDPEGLRDPWNPKPEKFSHEAFSWDHYGVDDYYPWGEVRVNEALFRETGRGHKKPIIWIFDGQSNLGKSTLARLLTMEEFSELSVYETDSSEELRHDDLVTSQIIVLGGKYPHTIEQIKKVFNSHGFDVEFVRVNFSTLS